MKATAPIIGLFLLLGCASEPPTPLSPPSHTLEPADFSGQWCRANAPLLRVFGNAPYFPGDKGAIRDLREAVREFGERS